MKFGKKALGLLLLGASLAWGAEARNVVVNVDQPGVKIGPMFYGLMTEEINHCYEGGLYAELIRNRIFMDDAKPANWSVVKPDAADASIAIDEDKPVNTVALKRSIRLDINKLDAGQSVGVANTGFWGIPVWPNTKYRASFYARANDGFNGSVTVEIQSNDGKTSFAKAEVTGIGTEWKKYEVALNTADVPISTSNRYVISTNTTGKLWLSLVSLFPPTYKDRPNGLRIDLMQKMAELNPKFLRFPGGNYLEGNTIADWFNWKTTIGPLEDRPGHACPWGYRSSDGMGLLEFLEWCEDINMEPVLGVYAGYSLRQQHINPGKDLEYYVQEALDEIEYVTGDVTTTWGARRAKDGHPKPFKLQYVEVGNEDWFDRSGSYEGRFAQFYDAIKAKYPNLQVISSMPVKSRKTDVQDDHYYDSARRMIGRNTQYDKTDRNGPKIFVGEWATQEGRPTPTMRAAVSDAVFYMGMERNADIVLMQCYAPLFVNVNPGASQWGTNLIGYDAAKSFGSPSFYAQSMLARNMGDVTLKSEVQPAIEPTTRTAEGSQGTIGVGTWATQAEFKDVKVTNGDQTLFTSDFTNGIQGWRGGGGANQNQFVTADGVLKQTSNAQATRIVVTGNNTNTWGDYTINLKARKTGGSEGFFVYYHVRGRDNHMRFNIGGWGNSRTGPEQLSDGETIGLPGGTDFKVETDKWYDVRVEVKGANAKCFVDDKLVAEAVEGSAKPVEAIHVAASRVDASGDLILKVVNAGDAAQALNIQLKGSGNNAPEASLETLSGNPGDVNTVEKPTLIAPKQSKIEIKGNAISADFPANSVNVIRLKTAGGK